jgi:hypothetical protein
MAGNSFGQLLTRIADEVASLQRERSNPPAFSIMEEGEAQVLQPSVQDEVYEIAREVICNAFQQRSSASY